MCLCCSVWNDTLQGGQEWTTVLLVYHFLRYRVLLVPSEIKSLGWTTLQADSHDAIVAARGFFILLLVENRATTWPSVSSWTVCGRLDIDRCGGTVEIDRRCETSVLLGTGSSTCYHAVVGKQFDEKRTTSGSKKARVLIRRQCGAGSKFNSPITQAYIDVLLTCDASTTCTNLKQNVKENHMHCERQDTISLARFH